MGGREHVGILATLTVDDDPYVRGTAAAGLVRSLLTAPDGNPLAEHAVSRCVSGPGTAVAVAVAAVLYELDPDRKRCPALRAQLIEHRSARVRALVSRS